MLNYPNMTDEERKKAGFCEDCYSCLTPCGRTKKKPKSVRYVTKVQSEGYK